MLEFIGMQEMTEMERSEIEVKLAFAVIRKETAIHRNARNNVERRKRTTWKIQKNQK